MFLNLENFAVTWRGSIDYKVTTGLSSPVFLGNFVDLNKLIPPYHHAFFPVPPSLSHI